MPPDSAVAGDRHYLRLRQRTLAFSLLGLLTCVVLVSLLEPTADKATHASAMDLLARAGSRGVLIAAEQAAVLVAVGVVAGLFAGMLGMGGGVVKVAGLLLVFHLDILLARAVSLTTMLVATASAARIHARQGTVMWRVVRAMLVPAALGVLVGIVLGSVLPRSLLRHFFGFFALFMGLNTLAQSFGDPHEHVLGGSREDAGSPVAHGFIGGVHGFVCGLLGISGGVIAIPMQQTLARIRAANAVANTIVVSAAATSIGSVTAVVGGVVQREFALLDVLFATACVGAGAALGAHLGAHLTGKIPVFVLRLLFVQICLVAGLSILIS